MKKVSSLLVCFVFFHCSYSQNLPSIYGYTATSIDGYVIPLSQFYGKKVMFVNTASYCGYTYQYTDLEKLYKNYKQNNFEILAFPCNDFGGQDPYSDSLIHNFCNTYSISFTLMSKISISTGDTDAVYKWLQRSELNGVNTIGVGWNFNKFLVNESGNWVRHYTSQINPLDTAIINWILSPSSIKTGIEKNSDVNDFLELTSQNPCQNNIEFNVQQSQNKPMTIRFYSLDGRLIKKIENISALSSQKIKYDVSDLESGVYFLSVTNGSIEKNIRVVVLR